MESKPNEVCQRGVDGSEGCGHGRVNDFGVCVEYLPQAMDYCKHFCDFSIRVPDERHEYVRTAFEGCEFVLSNKRYCGQPRDAACHAVEPQRVKLIPIQSSWTCPNPRCSVQNVVGAHLLATGKGRPPATGKCYHCLTEVILGENRATDAVSSTQPDAAKNDRCEVVPTSRSILERKLLAALDDDSGKVAILATKNDLDLFIIALEDFERPGFPLYKQRAKTFAKDLSQLRREAFGEDYFK